MADACMIPRPWGRPGISRPASPTNRTGYFLGRALVKAAAARSAETAPGVEVGRLGKALCGFEDPFHALPRVAARTLSIRVWNENEELDDAWQFTVTGPGGFSQVFDWDGGALNDTTYGPFVATLPGTYHISAVVTEEHENGNYFLVEIKDQDETVLLSTFDSPPDTDFELP